MRVLELFAGVGGHSHALRAVIGASPLEIVALEVNEHAIATFKKNDDEAQILRMDVSRLGGDEGFLAKDFDLLMMSPPCQPYSRRKARTNFHEPNKKKQARKDRRTKALENVIHLLEQRNIRCEALLLENVVGFENSADFDALTKVLDVLGFTWQCIILNSQALGIPNSRPRLYLLAKRKGFLIPTWNRLIVQQRMEHDSKFVGEKIFWVQDVVGSIQQSHGKEKSTDFREHFLAEFLEQGPNEDEQIALKTLWKAGNMFDVVTPRSKRSGCFTKSYGSFHSSTGSILCQDAEMKEEEISEAFSKFMEIRRTRQASNTNEMEPVLESLKLRYFSPKEIQTLLGFPASFTFADHLTRKQKFSLLGNSISVTTVQLLLNYLLDHHDSLQSPPEEQLERL